jgi:hypothetical protein
MPIDALIDKEDNFEIVRDQVADILALETDSQVELAKAANKKNPKLWKFRVFTERANPIEEWRDVNSSSTIDDSPIVNVWYDNGSFPMNKGNVVERQAHDAVINIDCYGVGFSADNPGGGHFLGDKGAALEAQRAVRLVRNILMAAEYTYLGMRGTVWRRWPQSITAFQPSIDERPVARTWGVRVALRVEFNELSPQVTPTTLDKIVIDTKRTEDGQIVLTAEYNKT